MPAPYPPEFRQRAVELARERAKPIAQLARDVGISESCFRNWMAQADVDEGKREGLTTEERRELTKLCRENRTRAMENEIPKRAAAHFARENVLPKWGSPSSPALLGPSGHGLVPSDEGDNLRLL